MIEQIGRRRFLQVSALGVAGLLTASCTPGELGSNEVDIAVPQLLPVLGPDVVNDIGRRYRRAYPDESSAPRLRAAIGASHRTTAMIGWTQQSLDEQLLADFAGGRTVVVNGWVLAVTEARQCALYSILHG